MSTIVSKGIF